MKNEGTKQIIERLQRLLTDLESNDARIIEEAAFSISGTLIALERELGNLDREFLEIEHLALDLEIPKENIEDYDSKLVSLKEKIKSLK